MTMEQFMRWLATAATLFVAVPVLAAQDDPRLDALFGRLAVTDDTREAQLCETVIWSIWHQSGDPRIDALMARGLGAMATEDYDEAEKTFTQIVERAPNFAEGWNKRATVRYLLGKHRGSIEDIDKTLVLEPRHFGALSGLGLVYLALGREDKALDAFKRALAVHPHLPGTAEKIEELEEKLKGRRT
jgi:tetratricopeptide (TPR) repeat protein